MSAPVAAENRSDAELVTLAVMQALLGYNPARGAAGPYPAGAGAARYR